MLHLIPAPLHRAALRLAHRARRTWWRIARPQLVGVNVIVLDEEGQVLLVRHSYEADRWTLPGGGMGGGEQPADAARRELREELGCTPMGLDPIGINHRTLAGAPCMTHVFAAALDGEPKPDLREIAEVRYFARKELPAERASMVDAALAMLEQR